MYWIVLTKQHTCIKIAYLSSKLEQQWLLWFYSPWKQYCVKHLNHAKEQKTYIYAYIHIRFLFWLCWRMESICNRKYPYLLNASVKLVNTKEQQTYMYIHCLILNVRWYMEKISNRKEISCHPLHTYFLYITWHNQHIFIQIYWFNLDALTHGNAYNPQRNR